MRNLKIILLLLLIAAPAYAAKITNGEQLAAAMHKKYDGKWYKTLTFVQKNTQYKPDGTTQNSIWYEAMSAPGRLRVDFDPLDTGNGMMFADGMQHVFKDGKLVKSAPLIHPLMVLGFDVYAQPVEKTVSQLKEIKVDLSTLHEEKLDGRDMYVLGAKQGDLRSTQIWVDKKNLYFVKMIETVGKNKDRTQETQFNKYVKIKSGGWVAAEVVFLLDGKRTFMEEYSDIQTNVPLDAKLFDPQSWMTADRTYFKKK
jgi:outer membrane lipoprotein-sorting protein